MRTSLLLFCSLSFSSAVSEFHSLQFYLTAVTAGFNFPEFILTAMLDEEVYGYYDSNINNYIPKTEWRKNISGADDRYWREETLKAQEYENLFINELKLIMQRLNQTGGLHTAQGLAGCELDDNGATKGYMHFGYDGEDFWSLDLKTVTWRFFHEKADFIKLKWKDGEGYWNMNLCMDWLKRQLPYSTAIPKKTVPPEVQVFHQRGSSSSELVCHATGFFPRGVMMSWVKDGEELEEDVEVGETLPNQDGSFQQRIILRVSPEDLQKNKYTCVIQQDDVKLRVQEIKTTGDGSDAVLIGIIVGAVVSLIVLVAGIVFWKKRNSGFKPTSSQTHE